MSNWELVPMEIYDDLFARFNYTNCYGEIEYDMKMVIRAMMTSTWFCQVFNGPIWMRFCSTFTDFERLECMYNDQNLTWQEIYRIRTSEVIYQDLLLVGDQQFPERLHLFQIYGNGRVYISHQNIRGDPFIYDMQPFALSPDDRMVKYGSTYYIMSPIEKVMGIELFARVMPADKMHFISMAVYSPYVLILTHHGRVFEMMFPPSYIEREEYMTPREVQFELNEFEKIIYVKCTPVANYAISNRYRIFTWSTIEDEAGEIMNTDPVVLTIDNHHINSIEYIDEEFTEFIDGTGEKIRVLNEEIYYLLTE